MGTAIAIADFAITHRSEITKAFNNKIPTKIPQHYEDIRNDLRIQHPEIKVLLEESPEDKSMKLLEAITIFNHAKLALHIVVEKIKDIYVYKRLSPQSLLDQEYVKELSAQMSKATGLQVSANINDVKLIPVVLKESYGMLVQLPILGIESEIEIFRTYVLPMWNQTTKIMIKPKFQYFGKYTLDNDYIGLTEVSIMDDCS